MIVVGVDGSETSVGALRWAVAEARLRGTGLVVLTAWHVPYAGLEPLVAGLDPEVFLRAARTAQESALAAVDTTGVDIERRLVEGGAGPALLEAARDAELVVVGTRGHGGVLGLLLGSVSHAVVQHAPCPVVVVPPLRG